jgi:hypothetical protein
MVGVRCCDYKRISLGEARYEDARIAGRNDHDLVSHASSIEHVCEIGWRHLIPAAAAPPAGRVPMAPMSAAGIDYPEPGT